MSVPQVLALLQSLVPVLQTSQGVDLSLRLDADNQRILARLAGGTLRQEVAWEIDLRDLWLQTRTSHELRDYLLQQVADRLLATQSAPEEHKLPPRRYLLPRKG